MNSTTRSIAPVVTEPLPSALGNLAPTRLDSTATLPSGENCLACSADDRLRFASLSGDEFISEFRHRLAVLTVRVQSDMPELESRIAANVRRLNTLEAQMPGLHSNRSLIDDVRSEVRALKRLVTELQCTVERQNRPLAEKVSTFFRELQSACLAPRA